MSRGFARQEREFDIETHEVARSKKVLEVGLAGGHAWRALTREGMYLYRHFGYRDLRVASCDKHLGTSRIFVSEGEELNIWK
jgi:hypothetical protein